MMNDKFYNLPKKKQHAIINAAIKEFTYSGYNLASTNTIVNNAGIGKGSLFYYFNNKEGLYLFLIEYCLDIINREYFGLIDTQEKDLFERFKHISIIKLTFLKRYPDSMNFIATVFLKDESTIEIKKQIEKLQTKGYHLMFKDIDYSLFRNDIDPEKAKRLIQWTFSGYEEDMKYRLKDEDIQAIDYQPYFDEFFDYIEVLKTAFYTRRN